jgi:hypothetical protein
MNEFPDGILGKLTLEVSQDKDGGLTRLNCPPAGLLNSLTGSRHERALYVR